MRRRMWLAWLLSGAGLVGAPFGCDAERGTRAASEMGVEAARVAREWAEGLNLGELSESAKSWLRRGAEASASGIEAVLQKGEQVVPVAKEIGGALASAIDADTTFEPIYQEVAGGPPELSRRRSEVDVAIQGMTRVEPIDGLQVGFKQLSSLDLGHSVSESAYLVMWRQGDRLVGFVFRSRRDVSLPQLVAGAPRLVGLVRSVL